MPLTLLIMEAIAGQLQQHTQGPHNSLRTRLRAARVYIYSEKVGREGIELTRRPLFINRKLR